MGKRAMLIANSASMIDHFNKDNIYILQQMGYDIVVAANFKEGNSSSKERIDEFINELLENDITILDLPIPRSVIHFWKIIKSIYICREYLKKYPCQIIHTQTPLGGVVGRIAARKARKHGISKVIYYVHGFHFFRGAGVVNHIIYYNIEKILSCYTDCLITLNKEDYKAATEKFHHKNVKYVAGVGVDTDAIYFNSVKKKDICERLHLPAHKRIIMTVAELIPRKNVAGCIRSFAKANYPDTILIICGKGFLLDELKRLCVTLGVETRVYFLGYRKDVLDIYHVADLFLFTSYQEGLPVAVMQAMATGIPVIASDIRGNRDLLAQEPDSPCKECLLPVKDINAFALKIREILDNPLLAERLGAENHRLCGQYFDIDVVHSAMCQVYQELDK